jgi:hypothetical protein
MDEATYNMKAYEAYKPQDNQNHCNCGKHSFFGDSDTISLLIRSKCVIRTNNTYIPC